ncbi:MAG: 4'-phosphopantetheinyl transferase superfamily protein [Firmicutes bacterium]|nr:4'-phosphopantetheinyl transferase superfamily protein [Bacillota bacterium]
MRIYLHEKRSLHGEAAYPLIRLAAENYIDAEGLDLDCDLPEERDELEDEIFVRLLEGAEIKVTEKGKPYFVDVPLEFSVTNSGDMWMCAVSEKPCGIDLQIRKNASYKRISDRFYRPKEKEFVDMFGEEGFFRIWTRREAYGKAIGEGFWGDIPEIVCEGARELVDVSNKFEFAEEDMRVESSASTPVLKDVIGDYFISEVEVGDGIYCAICTKDPAPYPIISF